MILKWFVHLLRLERYIKGFKITSYALYTSYILPFIITLCPVLKSPACKGFFTLYLHFNDGKYFPEGLLGITILNCFWENI